MRLCGTQTCLSNRPAPDPAEKVNDPDGIYCGQLCQRQGEEGNLPRVPAVPWPTNATSVTTLRREQEQKLAMQAGARLVLVLLGVVHYSVPLSLVSEWHTELLPLILGADLGSCLGTQQWCRALHRG